MAAGPTDRAGGNEAPARGVDFGMTAGAANLIDDAL